MQTSVHKVIVGKDLASNGDISSLKVGDVALFNQDRVLIKSEEDALKAGSIYVGVVDSEFDFTTSAGKVEKKKSIDYSMEIKKSGHPTVVINEFRNKEHQQISIEGINDADIVAGHRYVVRIVYKDFEINKYQVTNTYEIIAEKDMNLVNAFVKKINSHPNRRVNASNSAHGGLLLTAHNKFYNETLDSLNDHGMINMEVSFYKTIPGALLNNDPVEVPGVTIETVTPGHPGMGYWAQVRDAENRNMGYDGHVFTGAYPQIKQKLKTVKGTQYDQVLITSDNPYLSNDNQYIKTTPMTVEVYFDHKSDLNTQNFVKCVKAFVTGKKAEGE